MALPEQVYVSLYAAFTSVRRITLGQAAYRAGELGAKLETFHKE